MEAVTFTLKDDSQVYRLRYDFNAICDAEPAAGVNLLSAIAGNGVDARQTRGLLFAMLKPEHPLVTLAEAGELLTRELPTVLDALRLALRGAEEASQDEPQADQ